MRIETPRDLTEDWLTEVLGAGAITAFEYERIGTGQMSECYRVVLTHADGSGPRSVVLKVAASDPTSRQTGLALGLYEREVRFYTDIAPRLAGPVAPCHHAAFDPETGIFDLLLDDAAPARVGDEIRGATVEQALTAVAELGRLQAPVLGDQRLAESAWLNPKDAPVNQALITALYAAFVDRYADQITPEQRTVCEQLVACFDEYLAAERSGSRINGVVHGDFRLDNLLFGDTGAARPLTVVDWQTVTWGPAYTDLSYFLGCAIPISERRDHYDELLRNYHDALGPNPPLRLEDVREGVRRQTFMGVTMSIIASMVVERTRRGDEMFMTMLERNCSHVLDTGALEVLANLK